jgi:mono/diheme cytochrome c family protein
MQSGCGVCVCTLAFITGLLAAAQPQPGRLSMESVRHDITDLEVTGLISGLPAGERRFVTYQQLSSLPTISAFVTDDETLSEMKVAGAQIKGVPLPELSRALGVLSSSDGYEAHFTAEYVAAHSPFLAIEIDGLRPGAWARSRKLFDVGPYMITYAKYVPSYSVRAHHEEMQDPSGVVRLEYTTQARVYGAITPRGSHAHGEDEQAGFLIARQNCLRCHGINGIGGVKAQRSWQLLARFAHDDPTTFAAIVHNPRSVNPRATMPANLGYDGPTLNALIAYFNTLSKD